MPVLSRPANQEFCTLEPRQALVAADTDVLVVGGGPAGIGAAIGAADAGARVVLAERYGFLGGNATSGTPRSAAKIRKCSRMPSTKLKCPISCRSWPGV